MMSVSVCVYGMYDENPRIKLFSTLSSIKLYSFKSNSRLALCRAQRTHTLNGFSAQLHFLVWLDVELCVYSSAQLPTPLFPHFATILYSI